MPASGRVATRATITLVAAAKTQSPEPVRWVLAAGVDSIGHNYVRELRAMHEAVVGARWHYIGALQTNTAHHVAALADIVETLAGDRASERLARRAAEAGRVVDALVEVDFTGTRPGVAPEDLGAFVARVRRPRGNPAARTDDHPARSAPPPTTPARGSGGSARCVMRSARTGPTWWT